MTNLQMLIGAQIEFIESDDSGPGIKGSPWSGVCVGYYDGNHPVEVELTLIIRRGDGTLIERGIRQVRVVDMQTAGETNMVLDLAPTVSTQLGSIANALAGIEATLGDVISR